MSDIQTSYVIRNGIHVTYTRLGILFENQSVVLERPKLFYSKDVLLYPNTNYLIYGNTLLGKLSKDGYYVFLYEKSKYGNTLLIVHEHYVIKG